MPLNTKVTQTGNTHEVDVNDGGGGGAKERKTDVLVSWDDDQFYLVSSSPGGGLVQPKGSILWPKQVIPTAGKKFQVELACKITFLNKSSQVIATAHDCKGSSSDYASHDAKSRGCGLVLELGPPKMWASLATSLGISYDEARELVKRLGETEGELVKYLSEADKSD